MIEKMSYDQVLAISKDLNAQAQVINQLLENREIPELKDFTATVEGYSKFLENYVQINRDADEALKELIAAKKKTSN